MELVIRYLNSDGQYCFFTTLAIRERKLFRGLTTQSDSSYQRDCNCNLEIFYSFIYMSNLSRLSLGDAVGPVFYQHRRPVRQSPLFPIPLETPSFFKYQTSTNITLLRTPTSYKPQASSNTSLLSISIFFLTFHQTKPFPSLRNRPTSKDSISVHGISLSLPLASIFLAI